MSAFDESGTTTVAVVPKARKERAERRDCGDATADGFIGRCRPR
jgi:hypothetical protein